VTNLANPAATGQFIGAFISAGVLTLATPNEILPNTEAVVPTSAPTVDVNWSGEFSLTLDVYTNGSYAFSLVVDESVCTFDGVGAPITFDVN
jgi:hypothetical protein